MILEKSGYGYYNQLQLTVIILYIQFRFFNFIMYGKLGESHYYIC